MVCEVHRTSLGVVGIVMNSNVKLQVLNINNSFRVAAHIQFKIPLLAYEAKNGSAPK